MVYFLCILSVALTGLWQHWSKRVEEYTYPTTHVPEYSSILVPNVDNVRTDFLIEAVSSQRKVCLHRLHSISMKMLTATLNLESFHFYNALNINRRHMAVIMQLANPYLLGRSTFLSMNHSASPILHNIARPGGRRCMQV